MWDLDVWTSVAIAPLASVAAEPITDLSAIGGFAWDLSGFAPGEPVVSPALAEELVAEVVVVSPVVA